LDVIDADDMMQRFDTDGSGNLDEKEISAMKAYIQDKKDNLVSQREIAEEQQSRIGSAHDAKLHKDPKLVVQNSGGIPAARSNEAASAGDSITQIAFKNVSFVAMC